MKAEIEPLFGDSANEKTKFVIDTVTALYDDLFDAAKRQGANDNALSNLNRFIDDGVTHLVHEFSGYFDDDVKDFEAFFSLFETRKNEAIWSVVFTFYFNFDTLNNVPLPLAQSFVSRFWDCWHRPTEAYPYYGNRLSKIMGDRIYGVQSMDSNGTKHYDTKYIELFERYSRAVAERSPPEKQEKIMVTLEGWRLREPGRGRLAD